MLERLDRYLKLAARARRGGEALLRCSRALKARCGALLSLRELSLKLLKLLLLLLRLAFASDPGFKLVRARGGLAGLQLALLQPCAELIEPSCVFAS